MRAQLTIGGLVLSPTLAVGLCHRCLPRGTDRRPRARAWHDTARMVARAIPLALVRRSRALPVLALIVVLTFVAGRGRRPLLRRECPGRGPAASFSLFGARGVLLAARAAFIFGVAVVVGAVVGRALPALILTALIATHRDRRRGRRPSERHPPESEAVAFPEDFRGSDGPNAGRGDLYIDTAFQLPDGSLVGYEYFGDEACTTTTATRATRCSRCASRAASTGSSRPARHWSWAVAPC